MFLITKRSGFSSDKHARRMDLGRWIHSGISGSIPNRHSEFSDQHARQGARVGLLTAFFNKFQDMKERNIVSFMELDDTGTCNAWACRCSLKALQ